MAKYIVNARVEIDVVTTVEADSEAGAVAAAKEIKSMTNFYTSEIEAGGVFWRCEDFVEVDPFDFEATVDDDPLSGRDIIKRGAYGVVFVDSNPPFVGFYDDDIEDDEGFEMAVVLDECLLFGDGQHEVSIQDLYTATETEISDFNARRDSFAAEFQKKLGAKGDV